MRRAWLGAAFTLAICIGAASARADDPSDDPAVPGARETAPAASEPGAASSSAPAAEPEARSWLDDWSLLPVLFYSPETEVGFGLAVIRSVAIPEDNPSISTIALGVIYTTNNQFISRLEPDLRFGDRAFLHSVIRYQRYPTRFFEEGSELGDDGEPFDEETVMGHIDARVRVLGRLRAGMRWEYRYNDVRDVVAGGVLASSGYGGREAFFTSGLGPVLSYDTRDEPRLPTRGILAEVRALFFNDAIGSDYDYVRYDAELRGYLALGHCHVLAGEVAAAFTTGDMPFQQLPKLGGPNRLRGWYEGHVRDRHTLFAQLEWRYPIWDRIGGAAFFALGEAAPSLDALSLARVRAAGGAGLRYLLNKRQNVTVRFDLAWGSGLGAYVDVLEAF